MAVRYVLSRISILIIDGQVMGRCGITPVLAVSGREGGDSISWVSLASNKPNDVISAAIRAFFAHDESIYGCLKLNCF